MSKRKAKDSGSASILDFFGKSKRSTHEVREHDVSDAVPAEENVEIECDSEDRN